MNRETRLKRIERTRPPESEPVDIERAKQKLFDALNREDLPEPTEPLTGVKARLARALGAPNR